MELGAGAGLWRCSMKRWMVLATALAIVPAANAQYKEGEVDFTGWSVRLGYVYPFEDLTRSVTGNMFGIGIDIETPWVRIVDKGESYLSFEWMGKSLDGGKGNFIPIMFNQRFTLTEDGVFGPRSYFFVGAGVVNIDVFNSGLEYGVRGGYGYEFNENLFAEASLMFTTEADNARASSVGAYIGWRF